MSLLWTYRSPATEGFPNLVSKKRPRRLLHDDVIKWKYFPHYWPFVRGIHRSPVNSPHKGQWRGALMFTLICARINGWINNREAGDLRRNRTHYDVTVMCWQCVDYYHCFNYQYPLFTPIPPSTMDDSFETRNHKILFKFSLSFLSHLYHYYFPPQISTVKYLQYCVLANISLVR